MASKPAAPLVCVIAYEDLCTFEFSIAVEVFGIPRPEFDPWYRFRVVSVKREPVRGRGGITISASGRLSELRDASLIIVPGWNHPDVPVPPLLRRALIKAHENGIRIASICTGAFALAQCGLLDGKKATTHWRHAAELSRRFPSVDVQPDVLYVDEGNILTSAGAAAGLDLCLHIVRRDFGVERANAVAKNMVMPAHRNGGQTQFIPRPVLKERGSSIAALLDKIRHHLGEDWTIERMAKTAHVSRRTLLRRFHDVTGESPQNWLTAERIARSKELLETTRLELKEIASSVGFGSPELFRHHFRARVGTSPSAYRAVFGTGGFNPTDSSRKVA